MKIKFERAACDGAATGSPGVLLMKSRFKRIDWIPAIGIVAIIVPIVCIFLLLFYVPW